MGTHYNFCNSLAGSIFNKGSVFDTVNTQIKIESENVIIFNRFEQKNLFRKSPLSLRSFTLDDSDDEYLNTNIFEIEKDVYGLLLSKLDVESRTRSNKNTLRLITEINAFIPLIEKEDPGDFLGKAKWLKLYRSNLINKI